LQRKTSSYFRIANALSALYPKDSKEIRLLNPMLLAMPET